MIRKPLLDLIDQIADENLKKKVINACISQKGSSNDLIIESDGIPQD